MAKNKFKKPSQPQAWLVSAYGTKQTLYIVGSFKKAKAAAKLMPAYFAWIIQPAALADAPKIKAVKNER